MIQPSSKPSQHSYDDQTEFDLFTDELFAEQVTSDSITMNYTLANPENFGITDFKPTLGNFSVAQMQQDLATRKQYRLKLKQFDPSKLSKQQKLTFEILNSYLTDDKNMNDFILYTEVLGPTTGIQAQLPILLAEYNFYDQQDIEDYLTLLPCVFDYFKQIVTFEQQKSEAGLFMSDQTADDIIAQCNDFIKNKEENFLIGIFEEKIDEFDLTKEEKDTYIKKNRQYVADYIIPAYEYLIHGLTKLKGTGNNEKGLCYLPKGKEFYSYLVKTSTGSNRSMDEINSLLDTYLRKSMQTIMNVSLMDEDVFNRANHVTYPETKPEKILEYLKDRLEKDFPKLNHVNCTIKYVHKSLEDSLSPAFYLTPPIDCYTENSIYINQSDKYDMSSIFTTIAHEGYPGHLYQTVYYQQQNQSLIRSVMDYGGYSEGWATYVELYSYDLAGLDKHVSSLLKNNLIANLCLYAKCELGINYLGWDYDKTKNFLSQYGIEQESDLKRIYTAMIEEPDSYMKYTLGLIEILILREEAENALGDSFTLKDFHEFFLSVGPAPFDIIKSQMDQWIDKKMTN